MSAVALILLAAGLLLIVWPECLTNHAEDLAGRIGLATPDTPCTDQNPDPDASET